MLSEAKHQAIRKSCLVLSIFYFITLSAISQTFTQTIRGKIIDADSKSSIPGVNIQVLNLDTFIAAASDINGNFRLQGVPVGRQAIKATFIGYDDAILSNIIVGSAKEIVLTIEMREKVYSSSEIEIVAEQDKTKANNEFINGSARSFRSEETERYAGSRGDPSRMVANYAGVATGNDVRNDIVVRGNSPIGVLWRLEGVDIPNPNHFSSQGATGGPISMLNNNLLGNTDFITGAFPAEYGNKMSAVFDLKLRNGNNEKYESIAQIGFNGLEVGSEGPFSKKNGSSFLVNYRYSTLRLFDLAGIKFGVSALPEYQDASFKLNFPSKKLGILSIWGLGGKSTIALLDSKQKDEDWNLTSKGEDLYFSNYMGVAGIGHTYFFNQHSSGKLAISLSTSSLHIDIDTLSVTKEAFRIYKNYATDNQLNINYTYLNKINSQHTIKTGMQISNLFFNYKTSYYARQQQKFIDRLSEKNNSSIAQSFIHWNYKATNSLTFNTGLHYQYFIFNKTQAVEPRLGAKWNNKSQTWSITYGLHSQTMPLPYYFYKTYNLTDSSYIQTNKNLGLMRAHHIVLGYDLNFRKNFRVKIEPYYQQLYNIPVENGRQTSFSAINLGNSIEGLYFVDSLANKGTGRNAGIEFTLEKFFSNHYYFLTTLSLFDSKYKGSDGQERNTSFNNNYVYNILGGYEFPFHKNKQSIGIHFKATVAGGARSTPIDRAASINEKDIVYVESQAFSQQFAPYKRFDIKLSYISNRKKITQNFYVTVENIFNTKNILRQAYDDNKKEIVNEYQFGLFPYGGYRIEF